VLRKTVPFLLLLAMVVSIFALPSSPSKSYAQEATSPAASCADILARAVEQLSGQCNALDRDQVCYGNFKINVEYLSDDSTQTFSQPGDIIPFSNLKSISTAPLNLENGEWGLAIFKMQAKVPGTVAGQAVTFVLYGDTKLTPELTENTDSTSEAPATEIATEDTPLNATHAAENQVPVLEGVNAFYLTTGVASQAQCTDLPAGGMLVQSPKGQKLHFRVNSVDIDIASTIILRAQSGEAMAMSVLEGQGEVGFNGQERIVNAGQGIRIPLGGATGLVPVVSDQLSTPRPMPAADLQIPTVCQLGKAAGLDIPCDVPPVTSTPSSTASPTP
jgi:hypothetical protein